MTIKYFDENIGGPVGEYWSLWVALVSGRWCPFVSLSLSLSFGLCVFCVVFRRYLGSVKLKKRISNFEYRPRVLNLKDSALG